MKRNILFFEIAPSELFDRIEAIVETALEKRQKQALLPSKANDLLSSKDVCSLFGISPSSLYNHTRSGMIECKKMGRKNLYSKKQIESTLIKLNN